MLALVLSRKDLREFDQIISFYTKEHGKLEALAKGIKKITSKNSANLEPPSLSEIEIAKGKDLDHLTKVQPIELFGNIRQDLAKNMVAGYALKVLDRFTMIGERDERIFNLLFSFLSFLNSQTNFDPLDLVNSYLLKLWNLFGFGSDLDKFFKLQPAEKEYLEVCMNEGWNVNFGNRPIAIRVNQMIDRYVRLHSEKPLANFVKSAKMIGII